MEPTTTKPQTTDTRGARPQGRGGFGNRGGQGGPRRGGFDRPKPEFDQKILAIRRVTRVVSGGRRMTFSVAIAIGDKKGSVGLGTGKALDTSLAIGKALKSAKKNMIKIKLTKEMSIPHDVNAKYTSSSVTMMPNRGKGLVAGSAVRDVLILAGITNVTAKILSGSKNRLNNAQAAVKALSFIADRHAPIVAMEMTEKDGALIPETALEAK